MDKSPGMDQMHPRLLKELADTISAPLAIIFQATVHTSDLPQQWKDASITPIFKKGDRRVAANYRPVSLTSVVCKVMERLVVNQVLDHVKGNSLLCEEQHGFQSGRSTVTNLLEALNVWTEALMHGLPVDVIYLDYAKAFDTVPHERLLRQISSFGIKGKALHWIRSFLTGRHQQVRVNADTSTRRPVISGVPQGSVLGPILFTLFVSDVPGAVSSLISMFADDTKVYTALLEDDSSQNLADDLESLQEWSQKMQMCFHPKKCKVMHLGSKNMRHDYSMTLADGSQHALEKVDTEKDLGVTIDYKLQFSEHVRTAVAKANRILGCLRHTFKHMTKDTLLLLYTSLVRPHLEYATCVWSPKTKKDKDALERVQRRATKLVPELKEMEYHERLKSLKLQTLLFRRKRADLIQAYKIMSGKDSLNQLTRCTKCPDKSMFQLSLSQRTRGHELKLQKQEATGTRSNFFCVRVLDDWNSLSSSTVQSPTVNHFKSGLRSDWANHPDQFSYKFSY